ncbi:MAG: DUF2961 domain-containing protein, partial [Oscillospiraceae bacterium]|nr:DUF2961 domain-containing protein [Oscillospiraceae bacterium]
MRKKILSILLALAMLLSLIPAAAAEESATGKHYSFADLVERTYDMRYLATVPAEGEGTKQITSTDPASQYNEETGLYENWDGNADNTGYVRINPDNGYRVLADLKGPGYLTHIMTGVDWTGTLNIYIDGELVISDSFLDVVAGSYFSQYDELSFKTNLVYSQGRPDGYMGMINLFVPIAYNESCMVEINCNQKDNFYYTIGYYDLEPGATVDSFTWPMSEVDHAALKAANDILSDETVPYGDTVTEQTVNAGQTVTLFESATPGAITATTLKLEIPEADFDPQTSLTQWVLEMYWDNSADPAVSMTVADFYGNVYGYGEKFDGAAFGTTAQQEMYSQWYMPFNAAKVTLTNNSDAARSVKATVASESLTEEEANGLTRFHANWQRAYQRHDDRFPDAELLNISGEGRFVGTTLHVYQVVDGIWWGEGDEKFYIDGEKYPTWFGTGSEDYFCYAWCASTIFEKAYCGQPINDDETWSGDNQTQTHGDKMNYRLHILEPVSFHESFEGCIDKYYDEESAKYGASTFFYLTKETSGNHKPQAPTAEERIFNIDMLSGATTFYPGAYLSSRQIGTNTATRAHLQNVLPTDGKEWYGDVHWFWPVTAKGKEVEFLLDIPESGLYKFNGSFTTAFDYGMCEVSLDGQIIDTVNLASNPYNQLNKTLDILYLNKGAHILKLRSAGSHGSAGHCIGVNYFDFEAVDTSNLEVFYGNDSLLSCISDYTTAAKPGLLDMLPFTNDSNVWHNNTELFWTGGDAGAVSFALDIPVDTTYMIDLSYTKAYDFARFDVAIDGVSLGEIDSSIGGGAVLRDSAWFYNVKLTAGSHTLTIASKGKGAQNANTLIGIDYINFIPQSGKSIDLFFGGYDDLMGALTYADGAAPVTQGVAVGWHDGAHLFYYPGLTKAKMDFSIQIPVEGIYDVTTSFTRAADYGFFSLFIDGVKVSEIMDGYNTSVDLQQHTDKGIPLTAGTHTLTVEINGKNPSSGNYAIGIDYIRFSGKAADLSKVGSREFYGNDALLASMGEYTTAAAPTLLDMYPWTTSQYTWHNNTELFWTGGSDGSVSFTIDVAESGSYAMDVSYTLAYDFARFEVLLDGVSLGEIDSSMPGVVIRDNQLFYDLELEAGEHTLTITSKGTGATDAGTLIGIDYVALIPMEALQIRSFYGGCDDLLSALTYSDGEAPVGQAVAEGWHNGAHLFYYPGLTKAKLEFTISLPTTAVYDVVTSFTRAPDYGLFTLWIDGVAVGEIMDGYNATVDLVQSTATGIALTAGTHTLTILLDGKNEAARNYALGIDYIEFLGSQEIAEPAGDPLDAAREAACSQLEAYKNEALSSCTELQKQHLIKAAALGAVEIWKAADETSIVAALAAAKAELDTVLAAEYKETIEIDEPDDVFIEGGVMAATYMTDYSSAAEPHAQGLDASIWSNGAHFFWIPAEGDWAEFAITLPYDTNYDISFAYTTAHDYAAYDVYFNGEKLASVDAYGTVGVSELNLGKHSYAAGTYTLKLVCTGKNAASGNYGVGIDHIIFYPEIGIAQYKEAACKALESYKSSDDYTAAQWTTVQNTVSQWKDIINAATTTEEVLSLLADAKMALDRISTGYVDYDNVVFDPSKTPADFGWSTDEDNYTNWNLTSQGEPFYISYPGSGSKRIWKDIIDDPDNFTLSLTVKVGEQRAYVELMGVTVELNCEGGNTNQIFDKESWNWYDAGDQICHVTVARANGGDLNIKLTGKGNASSVTYSKKVTDPENENLILGVIDEGGSAYFSNVSAGGLDAQDVSAFGWDTDEIGGEKDFSGWTSIDGINITANYERTTGNHRIWKNLISNQQDFSVSMTVLENAQSSVYVKVLGQTVELDGRNGDGNQLGVKLNGAFKEWVYAENCQAALFLTRKDGGDIVVSVLGENSQVLAGYTLTPSEESVNVELGIYAGTASFRNVKVGGWVIPFTKAVFAGDLVGAWTSELVADMEENQRREIMTMTCAPVASTISGFRSDLIIIAHGLEDLLSGVSAAEFKAEYSALVADVAENSLPTTTIVLTGLPYVTDAALGDVTLETYAAYNAAIQAVAMTNGFLYADLYAAMGDAAWTVKEDGKTLNNAGCSLVAGEILEELMRSCPCLALNTNFDLVLRSLPEAELTEAALTAFQSASDTAAMSAAVEEKGLGLCLELYRGLSSDMQAMVINGLLAADRTALDNHESANALFLKTCMEISRNNLREEKIGAPFGTYVAVGDSITEGSGALHTEDNWVYTLGDLITALQGSKVNTIDKGISGTRMCSDVGYAPAAKDTVQEYIVANHPDLLTISYGINDYHVGTTYETFISTYDTYLAEVKAGCPNAVVMVLGLGAKGNFDESSGDILKWNAGIKALAEKYDFIYADTYHNLRGVEWLLADGLHPNNAGYRVMANAVLRALNAYVHLSNDTGENAPPEVIKTPGDFGWESDSEDFSGWTATDEANLSVTYDQTVNGRVWKGLLSDLNNFTIDLDVTNDNSSSTY